MEPTVSIVTVSYNAAQCIAMTIESVLVQSFTDLEYVFIDGKSTDGTVNIIESFRAAFTEKGIRYKVISEPDAGIYDAMNKGVREADGQWVLMLNAGDRLADENVLSDVFSGTWDSADVLYGDVVLYDEVYYKVSRAQALETITQDMPFCHQAVFVRRMVLSQYGFDTHYRLAADYNQLLRCYLDGKRFQYAPRIISVYDTAGVSETNFHKTLLEQKAIRESLGIKTARPILYARLMRLKARLIRRFLPALSRSESRGWYRSLKEVLDKE